MVKTSDNVNVTDAKMKEVLRQQFSPLIHEAVAPMVKQAVDDAKIRTGVVTKFYPYLDKAEVQLDANKVKVICRLAHRYVGALIDFYTPVGEDSFCEKFKEPCIIPREPLHCLVVKIHEDDSDDYLLVDYLLSDEIVGFAPPGQGAMRITNFRASYEDYIEFGGDGLKIQTKKPIESTYGEYEEDIKKFDYVSSDDVYSKEEVDNKINDELNVSYANLLEITENYKETNDNVYSLFRGDCWTVNNNYESSAAITSETLSDFTITGTFRTKNDLIGIYWNSEDPITHPYISYGNRSDYRGVTLEFDYNMTGCKDFSNNIISITLRANTGETYYVQMNRFIDNGHVTIDFSNLTLLNGNTYINANGEPVTVSEETPIDVSNLKSIMFVIVPNNYVENNSQYTIMANEDFTCEISNINVTNAYICNEHIPLEPHKYRLCEGYDDFYNFNPKRICREMRKLGYVEWLDLYIGASHYYEKSGTPNDVITDLGFNHNRTEKMVLDKTIPLNKAFIAWLDCYARELKANGTDKLIISVSMENLQCPTTWRQKDKDGNYAITGWVPSTFFYSPCHEEPLAYMQSVSEACLDIVVDNDMQPILQLGEAWWWWNENNRPNQPPCFYDLATKNKYQTEFEENIPEYASSWSDFNPVTIDWLNQQIVNYSWGIRSVVKQAKYENGLYMALFFPPSVLDKDRVPKMMQRVNYLSGIYSQKQLDVLQIEDYDWVTGISEETKERDRSHHPEAYEIGKKLGFPTGKQHYFGGFVLDPKDATEFWRLIKKSMDDAISKGFAEVFVWAGSQVRRDQKIIGYDGYELVQRLIK